MDTSLIERIRTILDKLENILNEAKEKVNPGGQSHYTSNLWKYKINDILDDIGPEGLIAEIEEEMQFYDEEIDILKEELADVKKALDAEKLT